ncbi:MaoC family dehydratase [Sphingopyxis sp. 550A]
MNKSAEIRHSVLETRVGEEFGVSPWLTIDQLRIDVFAAVTDDIEPLHNDPKWCERNSPYGRPIAHGFLTLSLLTKFLHQVTDYAIAGRHDSRGHPINYGFDRVRFLIPVAVGERIRCRVKLDGVEERESGTMLRLEVTVEIEGMPDKPALIADWLALWVGDD